MNAERPLRSLSLWAKARSSLSFPLVEWTLLLATFGAFWDHIAAHSPLYSLTCYVGGLPYMTSTRFLYFWPPPLSPQYLYSLSANLGYFLTPPPFVRTSCMETPYGTNVMDDRVLLPPHALVVSQGHASKPNFCFTWLHVKIAYFCCPGSRFASPFVINRLARPAAMLSEKMRAPQPLLRYVFRKRLP